MNKEKQDRYDFAYLKLALEWANLSYCNRKKVGALIVKDRMIIWTWRWKDDKGVRFVERFYDDGSKDDSYNIAKNIKGWKIW